MQIDLNNKAKQTNIHFTLNNSTCTLYFRCVFVCHLILNLMLVLLIKRIPAKILVRYMKRCNSNFGRCGVKVRLISRLIFTIKKTRSNGFNVTNEISHKISWNVFHNNWIEEYNKQTDYMETILQIHMTVYANLSYAYSLIRKRASSPYNIQSLEKQ